MPAWTTHNVDADARLRSNVFRRAVAAAAVIVLISSGCGGDDGTASTAPRIAPTSTTSAPGPTTNAPTIAPPSTTIAPPSTTRPTIATIPEPVTYVDQATYVSGTIENLNLSQGTLTDDANGASHSRDGTLSFTMTANDPRASGTFTATWNSERWGIETNGALVQWGDAVLTNDNGTWEGPYTGAFVSDRPGGMITRWLVGTGAYEGLTFYWWSVVNAGRFNGLIYRGEPPPNAV